MRYWHALCVGPAAVNPGGVGESARAIRTEILEVLMKKILISAFVAALGLFGTATVRSADASNATLDYQNCMLRSGNWFCFYHNGVAYYTQCTATYPEPTTCNGMMTSTADKTVKKVSEKKAASR
jgi:hypothetical protein